ncbi:hypothetical protein [Aliarcobacter butzleri]
MVKYLHIVDVMSKQEMNFDMLDDENKRKRILIKWRIKCSF